MIITHWTPPSSIIACAAEVEPPTTLRQTDVIAEMVRFTSLRRESGPNQTASGDRGDRCTDGVGGSWCCRSPWPRSLIALQNAFGVGARSTAWFDRFFPKISTESAIPPGCARMRNRAKEKAPVKRLPGPESGSHSGSYGDTYLMSFRRNCHVSSCIRRSVS